MSTIKPRSKSIKFAFSKNRVFTIGLDLPQIPREFVPILNLVNNMVLGIFIVFSFVSFQFNFSQAVEFNSTIFLLITVIVLLVVQIIRFIYAGGELFPKIRYDLLLIAIVPTFLISSIFSQREEIRIFGDETNWPLSPMIFLTTIGLVYFVSINLSNFKKEKIFLKLVDVSLLVTSITALWGYLFDLNSIKFSFLPHIVITFIPFYLYRIFKKDKNRLIPFLVIVSGLIVGSLEINRMYDFLSNTFYRQFFKPPIIGFIIIFDFLIILSGLIFGKSINFKFGDYIKSVDRSMDKEIKGNLIKDLKTLIIKNSKQIFGIFMFIFTAFSIVWLITTGFGDAFFRNWFEEWKFALTELSLKEILIGSELAFSGNFFLSIFKSFGFLGIAVIVSVFGFMLFDQVRNFRKNSIQIQFLILFITVLLHGLLFDFGISSLSILIVALSGMIIASREEEIDLSEIKFAPLTRIKDEQFRAFANYLRIILSVVTILLGLFFVSFIIREPQKIFVDEVSPQETIVSSLE